MASDRFDWVMPDYMGAITGLLRRDVAMASDTREAVWKAICQRYRAMAPLDPRRVYVEATVSQELAHYDPAIFSNELSDETGLITCGMSYDDINPLDQTNPGRVLVYLIPLNMLYLSRRNLHNKADCVNIFGPIFVEDYPDVPAVMEAIRLARANVPAANAESVEYLGNRCSRQDLMDLSRPAGLLEALMAEWGELMRVLLG